MSEHQEPGVGCALTNGLTIYEHRSHDDIGWYDWNAKTWLTWQLVIDRGGLPAQCLIPEPNVEWLAEQLYRLAGLHSFAGPGSCRNAAAGLLDALRTQGGNP